VFIKPLSDVNNVYGNSSKYGYYVGTGLRLFEKKKKKMSYETLAMLLVTIFWCKLAHISETEIWHRVVRYRIVTHSDSQWLFLLREQKEDLREAE
jgi:hypothetical protein